MINFPNSILEDGKEILFGFSIDLSKNSNFTEVDFMGIGKIKISKISKSIYKDLDERLEKSKFLAGEYSIADIATFPWIARHEWHDIGLKKFEGLTRWYKEISKREAVIKGYDLLKKGEAIPKA